ncbi:RNA polymerase sigma factor [Lentibacillus amyloliquefaciens]|uniref:RNA polymerase sigma factor n=1 Tax=Lentibacillus amyloliquefaciens TaxID=1472767 RepID=A0A0U4EIV7_9BACI|nr:RNA polymerase sigma factor [Lentibacillus amyloliquefaciens]ALX50425.1 hypothetical protein AOX59_18675 [Lentibacillus amyloliquefaciens]
MDDLIEASRSGDTLSFNKLIDYYSPTVERFAFQIGVTYHDVPDVTQEVFIRIYRFLDQFDGKSFTSWLYKVTLNVVRDYHRKQTSWFNKFSRIKHAGKDLIHSNNSVESQILKNEEDQILYSCIQQLDKKYRIPIVLYYFHDLSYDEISQVTGVKLSTVKVRMLRGKNKLKNLLTDQQNEGGISHG